MPAHTELIRKYIVATFAADVDPDELPVDYDLVSGGIIDSLSAFVILAWLIETFPLRPVDGVTPDELGSIEKIDDFVARHAVSDPEGAQR